jgi:hypothetical protein
MHPYRARSFRFIALISIDDWRMKLYGIASSGELPRPELIEAAKQIAADQLAKEKSPNYKVGFIGVHDGRDGCFVFVDFWGTKTSCFIARFFRAATIRPD